VVDDSMATRCRYVIAPVFRTVGRQGGRSSEARWSGSQHPRRLSTMRVNDDEFDVPSFLK